jgi:hypothetical protein
VRPHRLFTTPRLAHHCSSARSPLRAWVCDHTTSTARYSAVSRRIRSRANTVSRPMVCRRLLLSNNLRRYARWYARWYSAARLLLSISTELLSSPTQGYAHPHHPHHLHQAQTSPSNLTPNLDSNPNTHPYAHLHHSPSPSPSPSPSNFTVPRSSSHIESARCSKWSATSCYHGIGGSRSQEVFQRERHFELPC